MIASANDPVNGRGFYVFIETERVMTGLLNFTQHNKIFINLRGFEEDLRKAAFWLNGGEENGILYHHYLNLSQEYYPHIISLIDEALSIINELVIKLNLTKEEENAARMLMGKMTMNWAALSDCHAKNLRGSGTVHPDLAELLDAPIDRLAQIALDLGHIFGQGPRV